MILNQEQKFLEPQELPNYNYQIFRNIKEQIQFQEKINPVEIAEEIINTLKIITFDDTKEIYKYNQSTGLYEPFENQISEIVQYVAGRRAKTHLVNETREAIARMTFVKREQIGKNLEEIPLENCIYNFAEKKVYPYTQDKIFLTKHPITWTEEEYIGENPIDKFIEEVTENQEDMLLLKEIIGYCFYRGMPFQNFFILVGKGANGKSVYLNLIRKMLGEKNVSNQSLQALSEGGFNLIRVYNKNANIFGDLPRKAFQDVGIIKELTGGDTIEANQKFKEHIYFKNFAKLISSCNEVPETPDQSDGFFRRAIIINFPNSFEGKENRNLIEELTTPQNLSDFFKSCIDSFGVALENNCLMRNEKTEEKRDKYLVYSNSSVAFCHSKLEYDPESYIESDEIYNGYLTYCKEKKVPFRDERTFYKSLYSHFGHKVYKKRKTDVEFNSSVRTYVIQGVCWK